MWMKEALRFMADNLSTKRPDTNMPGLPAARTRRSHIGLVIALPFLVALISLMAPAGAMAQPAHILGGTGCSSDPGGCANTNPAYGSSGTQVTVKGSGYTPGHILIISYSPTSCSSGTTQVAKGTADGSGNINIS